MGTGGARGNSTGPLVSPNVGVDIVPPSLMGLSGGSSFGNDSLFTDGAALRGGLGLGGLGVSDIGGSIGGLGNAQQIASETISGFLGLSSDNNISGLVGTGIGLFGAGSTNSIGGACSYDDNNSNSNCSHNSFGLGNVIDDVLVAKEQTQRRGPPAQRR